MDYGYGSYAWTMSSDYFVKEAFRNVKKFIREYNMEYNKKLYDIHYSPKNTFSVVGYRPEFDTSS